MSDNDDTLDDSTDILIDLDDVEGHGLREVAAGLGAAAVLAGGGAGIAAAAQSSAPLSVHPSATISSDGASVMIDPIGTLDRATDAAINDAREARDGALGTAGRVTANSVRTAGNDVDRATSAATTIRDNTTAQVRTDVRATKQVAEDVRHFSVQTVKQAAQPTVRGTVSGTETTATHATGTAGSTADRADRKVATVLSVVTRTTANGVHTATATLKAVNAGAGIDAAHAGGWVLVKAGDNVLAQVHLEHGAATASWTMPAVGGHSVTISYTGDDVFAPSLRTLAL